MRFARLSLALLVACTSGCGSPYDERIAAAEKIQFIDDRGHALAAIASDAAQAGDSAVVKRVLEKIQNIEIHDAAAEESAHQLVMRGDHISAREIAERIRQIPVKDRTMAKIASEGK